MSALRGSDTGDETTGFDDSFGPDEDDVDSFENVGNGRVEDDRAWNPSLGEDLMCLETTRVRSLSINSPSSTICPRFSRANSP